MLAFWGGDLRVFAAVMAGDSFGISFAGVALVTYNVEPDQPSATPPPSTPSCRPPTPTSASS
ncbi:MAG: hypothetical protein WDM92_15160 [Caulobacteraceae bacterium]